MSNFGRLLAIFAILISKMALFLILSLMDFFGEFSIDPVWKSLEARHVNSTGILYAL